MKMMQGADFLACSNKSLTREAPTPAKTSTNSEAEMLKKGTPASPATALANRVFPVPGICSHGSHGFISFTLNCASTSSYALQKGQLETRDWMS